MSTWLKRRNHNMNGFTLIELIIAFSIVALISLVILSGLQVGSRAWEVGESRIELSQRVRIITEIVSTELQSAFPYYFKDEDYKKKLQFCLAEDRIDFVSSAESLLVKEWGMSMGLREVSIYVEDSTTSDYQGLVMREAPLGSEHPFDPDRGRIFELDRWVTEVFFELIPIYNSETGEIFKAGDVEWCYPEEEELIDRSFVFDFGLPEQDARKLQKMWGEKLPMAVEMTLTFIDETQSDPVKITLPPFYFPFWNTRVLEYPKEKGEGEQVTTTTTTQPQAPSRPTRGRQGGRSKGKLPFNR